MGNFQKSPVINIFLFWSLFCSVIKTQNFFCSLFWDQSKDILEAFSQVCSIDNPEGSNTSHNFSIFETIERMCPNKSSVIHLAMWRHHTENAGFEIIFTNRGLCYTFNSINSEEIYTDESVHYYTQSNIRANIFIPFLRTNKKINAPMRNDCLFGNGIK